MSTHLIDKRLLRRRIGQALRRRVPEADFLLAAVVEELGERLAAVERRFGVGVVMAGHTEALERTLRATGKVERLFRLEQSFHAFGGAHVGAVMDEEALPLASESLDLLVCGPVLQWTNDLPGALLQIRRALRPDGLFLGALTGGQTLHELREALFAAETEIRGGASPRVLPAVELRDMGALLQRAGFALPVVDRDRLTIRYATAFDLLRDLRAMGAANVITERDRRPVPRRLFLRAAEIYAERFSDPDGRVRATFEAIYLSGWAPHESQQQPARRGSATVSLASVLGSGSNLPE